ncbi:MAG: hypothetical protein ACO1N0_00620 [Fluviicola sp.]
MAEAFRISEEDQENIYKVLNQVRSDLELKPFETLQRIAESPISFFKEAGMSQTIQGWFYKFPTLFRGFQRSMRSLSLKLLNRLKKSFNDCAQCIIAVVFMLWVVRTALRNESQTYADFDDAFIEVLDKSWVGKVILGSGFIPKGLIDPIVKTIGFDWRPQKIAQYICFKVGICPNPYIYE